MAKILKCKLCGKNPNYNDTIDYGIRTISLECCDNKVYATFNIRWDSYLDEEDAIIMHWNIINKKEEKD